MNELYKRTAMLIGEDKVNALKEKTVAVFGVGGVGGYVAATLTATVR